jgi:hypothetical protein
MPIWQSMEKIEVVNKHLTRNDPQTMLWGAYLHTKTCQGPLPPITQVCSAAPQYQHVETRTVPIAEAPLHLPWGLDANGIESSILPISSKITASSRRMRCQLS